MFLTGWMITIQFGAYKIFMFLLNFVGPLTRSNSVNPPLLCRPGSVVLGFCKRVLLSAVMLQFSFIQCSHNNQSNLGSGVLTVSQNRGTYCPSFYLQGSIVVLVAIWTNSPVRLAHEAPKGGNRVFKVHSVRVIGIYWAEIELLFTYSMNTIYVVKIRTILYKYFIPFWFKSNQVSSCLCVSCHVYMLLVNWPVL